MRRGRLLEYSIRLMHLCSLQSLILARLTIMTSAVAFWENVCFDECVLQDISGACVHTKPRGIEVTGIISRDREDPT